MDSKQALKETMFRFNLTGVELAERAGVKATQISAFRTGLRDVYVQTLDKIVNALPTEARAYYYELQWKVSVNPVMPELRFNLPPSKVETADVLAS